jgi:hypothetical protein
MEQVLLDAERTIAAARARQAEVLAELDAAQVAMVDGSRPLSDWVAAKLDVSHDTARASRAPPP